MDQGIHGLTLFGTAQCRFRSEEAFEKPCDGRS